MNLLSHCHECHVSTELAPSDERLTFGSLVHMLFDRNHELLAMNQVVYILFPRSKATGHTLRV